MANATWILQGGSVARCVWRGAHVGVSYVWGTWWLVHALVSISVFVGGVHVRALCACAHSPCQLLAVHGTLCVISHDEPTLVPSFHD